MFFSNFFPIRPTKILKKFRWANRPNKTIVNPGGNRRFSFGALCVGVLALAVLISYIVFAWTEPTSAPPTCPTGKPGCDAPLNVGPTTQTKTGNLILYGGNLTSSIVIETGWRYVKSISGDGWPSPRCNTNGSNCDTTYTNFDCPDPSFDVIGDGPSAASVCYDWARDPTTDARIHKKYEKQQPETKGGWVTAHSAYGDSIRIGGDAGGNDLEIRISAPSARNLISFWNDNSAVDGFANIQAQDIRAHGKFYGDGSGLTGITASSVAWDNITGKPTEFTPPVASATTLGGIKVGDNLSITADGVLSVSAPAAGDITGSGTTNYLAKFTGTKTIGDSLIFDNGTNIGIGTTAPVNKLQLDATGVIGWSDQTFSSNVLRIRTANSADDNWGIEQSGGQTFNGIGVRIYDKASQGFYVRDVNTGNYRLVVGNNGNVGIGTTEPQNKLDVAGNLTVRENIYLGNDKSIYNVDIIQGYNDLRLFGNSNKTAFIWLDSPARATKNLIVDGNVGIGTTEPGTLLDIRGDMTIKGPVNQPSPSLILGAGVTDIYGSWKDYQGRPHSDTCRGNDNINAYTCPADSTETCIDAVKMVGTGGEVSYARRDVTCYLDSSTYSLRNAFGTLQFISGSATDPRVVIGSDGNVGIGTTAPGSKLDVRGHVTAQDSDADFVQLWADGAIISGRGGSMPALRFGFADNQGAGGWAEMMRINENGNVGIGTTAPEEKLTVNGNIDLNGNYLKDGYLNHASCYWTDSLREGAICPQGYYVAGIDVEVYTPAEDNPYADFRVQCCRL